MEPVHTCACGATGFSEDDYLTHLDQAHPSKHPWRCFHCHGWPDISDMSSATYKELHVHKMAYHPDRFNRLKEIKEYHEIKFEEVPANISYLLAW